MPTLRSLSRGILCASLLSLTLPAATLASDWDRPFVTLGLGGSDSTADWTAGGTPIFALPGFQDSGTDNGLALSAEFGRMYRNGDLLLGWTFGLTDLDHEESRPSTEFAGDTFSTRIGPMLTLAGRVGHDFGNWMVYGEAGLAVAKIDVPNQTPVCPTVCILSLDGRSAGYVAGIGADYRISDRYAVGINYRHIGFEDRTASGMISSLGAPQSYEVGGEADVLSLRLTITLG
ncbi:MAG: porin family protein [Rhodobacteraceae bacterium]|nr:porin family protein [Paracoccaceae bacterium]MBR9821958.1 porin family protein [Paracoccaceae bacterium]